ncbi:MAG TPA: phosphate signaling complex protein PhoU [Syntrophorhabdaceae bacterium]|jgi:phosphate transport system protein|nr:phosphate signaling complex protein PhoU [Syntrophorhabdaceae bacterium]MBV6505935.1 Phosphate-specific transport system accessory protein PhoU [Syntrophorhabdaceae bacterium]HNQ63972.1 phosphate signaling complex protein PhoU [Syntrophorhabdaceae bacterium]HNZ59571.1 phosphate signaling complex protein PhoU [Syntrophorhabdaceae bacterium]HOB69841.1 phosphate signaling complex protein PhoU [Syntrophorhabdaceae bacterium]
MEMTEGHIYRAFDLELRELKEKLLYEGDLVEKAFQDAIKALLERNSQIAEKVVEDDDIIDAKEVEIDEFCLKLLALRQPAARDLRFITTAIKVNYDLERIGDLAVNVSEHVLELNKESQLKPYIDLPTMASIVQTMVKESLEAFVKEDVELAMKVTRGDERVDQLHDQIFRELLTYMGQDLRTITRATRLLFISKHLERAADHAVNIAELVIFMVEGKIIRHLKPIAEE